MKREWSDFINDLMDRSGYTLDQIAHYVGCQKTAVCRWRSPDVKKGTIPSSVSRKRLVELARKVGMID